MREGNIVYEQAKKFALRIYLLKKYLCAEHHEFTLADQVLRSGTSIGANISEAIDAFSRADFHYKLTIALKECSETKYWLELLHEAELISDIMFDSMYTDLVSIYYLLTSTCKKLQRHPQND